MSAPDPECPGDGKCHGCMRWCDWCGDVSNVCDCPECDEHPRPEDLAAESADLLRRLSALREEVRVTDRENVEVQERLASATKAGSALVPRPPGWKNRLRRF